MNIDNFYWICNNEPCGNANIVDDDDDVCVCMVWLDLFCTKKTSDFVETFVCP